MRSKFSIAAMLLAATCIGFFVNAGAITQAQTIVDHRRSFWSDPVTLPLVPAAAANLPDGRVLTWSATRKTTFTSSQGRTSTSIFDPVHMTATDRVVSNTRHDMFCPGTAQLADGRIMVTGGSNAGATSFYNPVTSRWTQGPRMNIPRGYHSMTPMADGSVFTLGGSWSGGLGGKSAEIWREGEGWRSLTGITTPRLETNDPEGVFRSDNHMWLFEASDGRIFHAGPSREMHWLDLSGNGRITSAGDRGTEDAMNGNAVMFDRGRILAVGGARAYNNRSDALSSAFVIDINNGVDSSRTSNMTFPRTFANSVVLPSGEVVVVGGLRAARIFTDADAVLPAEAWNPITGQWKTLASLNEPRTYHSVGLLLKDGRVMAGGGGLCDCNVNHLTVEVLTPPYLLNRDGTPAERPRFRGQISARATIGSRLTVQMNTNSAHDFALVRTGVATHSVNNDQRRVPLTIANRNGSEFTLQIPRNPSNLPPGEYFLFAINRQGVPSVAENIRITTGSEVALRDSRNRYVRNIGGRAIARNQRLLAQSVLTVEEENGRGEIAIRDLAGNFLESTRGGASRFTSDTRTGNANLRKIDRSGNSVSLRNTHGNLLMARGGGDIVAVDGSPNAPLTNFDVTEITNLNAPRSVTIVGPEGRFLSAETGQLLRAVDGVVARRRQRFSLVPVGANTVAIEASSRRYVSARNSGRVGDTASTIGARETFRLVRNNDGSFSFRSNTDRFLTVQANGFVTTAGRTISDSQRLRITFD